MTGSSQNGDAQKPIETSYRQLFARFLRFGLLAWGGPVAQIGMIRHELVEEEKWITRERFNRVFAVYQALPGPEAHEMCVYFGMRAKGRMGGLLAGLGFMLPGFVLMFALSWFYVTHGINSPLFAGVFYGMQAAVPALIIRATHRIGRHALTDRVLWGVAIGCAAAHLIGVHFLFILLFAGVVSVFSRTKQYAAAAVTAGAFLILISVVAFKAFGPGSIAAPLPEGSDGPASIFDLLVSGLRSGALTFGGAYTVISFLQHDAVEAGRWMTNAQFLDGLALSGMLPAPLIIFATFVGYVGGGAVGALVITAAIFFPAFAITLIGYDYVEKLVANRSLHAFLDGLTAGVVGLIAATTVALLRTAIVDVVSVLILVAGLVVLYRWKSKLAVAAVVVGAGLVGWLYRGT